MELGAGRPFASRSATLHGHRRRLLRGEVYPAVIAATGERTDGVVYGGLDVGALERLDRFEGAHYERQRFPVQLADGADVAAFVYVLRAEYASLLGDALWDEATFRARHLRDYLVACRASVRAFSGESPGR
ncbi:MAG: gamma-glutamylcyclotransferase [Myxococcales bacterium]|nr:MAG: gamma-glutamylcyclotransferase [Myxococcales bacterium]